ncbi:hypothetical protein DFH11DRAFT_1503752 [Phellopilus nigrolimitatus]|nr:hypothetical protein DFH11DRAFT_1503752 [Phellopilus nigrolimitatus]
MSIVIPAGQLTHTIITIRCDAPRTAPQIECALDEHTPLGNSSHVSRPPSASTSSLSMAGQSSVQRADLNVERGVDQRGHFVRLSFLPASRFSHVYGRRQFEQEIPDASYFPSGASLPAVTRGQVHSQEASMLEIPPYPPTTIPELTGGRSFEHPSATVMNNGIQSSTAEEFPVDVQDPAFNFSSDLELMTAFDSFMNGCDFSQSVECLMSHPDHTTNGSIPGFASSSQQFIQTPVPASPEMSSSSSSSSGLNSPTTPFDFFPPASAPSTDNSCNNGMDTLNPSRFHDSPESSLASSPALTHRMPATDSKPGTPGKLGESRLLPCPQQGCRRQFKSTSTLSGHMKTHAGKGARFPCSFPPCTEKFSRRHDQLRHEVYKHGKRCEWVCTRCNSFFSYERSLEKHTCTMDKSRRGSVPYLTAASTDVSSDGVR